MNTRTRSVLSAVLVGLMGASLVESSRGDYVANSIDLGGAYQQDFNYYGVSLVGAAYGVFQDYINVGFVGFQLQTNPVRNVGNLSGPIDRSFQRLDRYE